MAHKKKYPVERYCEFGDVKIPILEIPVHHQPSLVIGRRSGKAILENIDAIREFVARHETVRCAVEQMCNRPVEWD